MFIVTGAAGFIGSAMIWRLNRAGFDDILAVDLREPSADCPLLRPLHFKDALSWTGLEQRLRRGNLPRIRGIFHLGACSATTELNWAYLKQVNLECTRTLARWCLKEGVRFIYASSASTYGGGEHGYEDDESRVHELRPLNLYGRSKQLLDEWAVETGAARRMVGLKFFNVFGPNEQLKGDMASVVFKAFHQIRKSGRIELFRSHRDDYRDGEQMRDFVYVKDVVDILWHLWGQTRTNGIFNVGTGKARSWNDLARAVFAALEVPERIEYVDMPASLRNHYQYFTEASMNRLTATGCPGARRTLESAVRDYVRGYLLTQRPFLHPDRECDEEDQERVPAATHRACGHHPAQRRLAG